MYRVYSLRECDGITNITKIKAEKKHDSINIPFRRAENCVFGSVKFAFNCMRRSKIAEPPPRPQSESEIKFDISIFITRLSPGCWD